MTHKYDGGSAFPFWQTDSISGQLVNGWGSAGMSLRDWFAGLAMQGIVTHKDMWGQPDSVIAESAYNLADAMLALREHEIHGG